MKTMTPEQKIIAIAEWEGWKEVDSPNPQFRRLLNGQGKLFGSTEPERMRDLWLWAVPPYLTSRDAICGAVARLGDVRLREYAKNLQEVCHQYCVGFVPDYQHDLLSLAKLTLATPTQLADALLLTLGHEI